MPPSGLNPVHPVVACRNEESQPGTGAYLPGMALALCRRLEAGGEQHRSQPGGHRRIAGTGDMQAVTTNDCRGGIETQPRSQLRHESRVGSLHRRRRHDQLEHLFDPAAILDQQQLASGFRRRSRARRRGDGCRRRPRAASDRSPAISRPPWASAGNARPGRCGCSPPWSRSAPDRRTRRRWRTRDAAIRGPPLRHNPDCAPANARLRLQQPRRRHRRGSSAAAC